MATEGGAVAVSAAIDDATICDPAAPRPLARDLAVFSRALRARYEM